MANNIEKSERLPAVVRMEKNGEKKDVIPADVEAQKLLGWVVRGEGNLDGKGNFVESAKVIGTPAHTFMTSEGYLKAIPENYNDLLPVVPLVEQPVEVKPTEKKL